MKFTFTFFFVLFAPFLLGVSLPWALVMFYKVSLAHSLLIHAAYTILWMYIWYVPFRGGRRLPE